MSANLWLLQNLCCYGFVPFFALMTPRLLNKGFNGWSQLGIFMGMVGVGLVAGSVISLGTWTMMTGQNIAGMQQDLMNPKYATAIKVVQLVSTLFIFFLPALAYVFVCYRNGWLALGFQKNFAWKVAVIAVLIIIASMPFIDWVTTVNKAIPIPAAARKYFDELEKSYEDQVKVIGDVKTTGQYLVSLFIIALLPAVFEEVFFRGALQNMLSRWKNNSYVYVFMAAVLLMAVKSIWLTGVNSWFFNGAVIVLALLVLRSHTLFDSLNSITSHWLFPIIVTGILFSAVHASWYGFIPRLALGIILGLIFYRTNNIIYTVIVHFFNNAAVVTIMFLAAKDNKPVADAGEQNFPWWSGLISLALLIFLFRFLAKQPHAEKPVEVIEEHGNPFQNNLFENKGEQ